MTAQRLIQNFRKFRGSLSAGSDFQPDVLERTLLRLGVSLARVDQVDPSTLDPNRDIVFVDADQPLNPAMVIEPGATLPAAAVIGIVGVEAPSRLRLLAEAGATAILRKPVQAAAVYSALFLGLNTYRRLCAAELRLADHDRRRRGRRFVVKAIVSLVQTRGLSDDEAYAALRRESMRRRMELEHYCEALFDEGSSVPDAWPVGLATQCPPREPRRDENASSIDGRSCLDGTHDAGGDPRRRSDQARRA